MITIKSRREIEKMRKVGKLAAETLDWLGTQLKVGMTTDDINTLCHDYTLERGGTPATLGYNGFPKSLCTSPNDVICHGIPDPDVVLEDGDILNLDVTTILDGFHGDTNRTFLIGNVSEEHKKLVKVTYDCMMAGINQIRPGGHIGDIGAAIQELAGDLGYAVVRDYCGHGIGREFHEDPQVVHVGTRGSGPEMKPGMTFTVEPMINLGTDVCVLLDDDWTVVTEDGKFSAQFEHTCLVTEDGFEILTQWPNKDAFIEA